ncbi:MAG: hypothetical protein ACREAU_00430 [Nitrosopumilaceae archaeon]
MATIIQQIQVDVSEREEMENVVFEEILAELDMEQGTAPSLKQRIPVRPQQETNASPGDIVMINAGEGARRAYVVTKASKAGKVEITWLRSGKKHSAAIDVKDLKSVTASRYTRGQMLAKGNPQAVLEPGVAETKANIYNYTKDFSFMTI